MLCHFGRIIYRSGLARRPRSCDGVTSEADRDDDWSARLCRVEG